VANHHAKAVQLGMLEQPMLGFQRILLVKFAQQGNFRPPLLKQLASSVKLASILQLKG
jgi:hypothetical protein